MNLFFTNLFIIVFLTAFYFSEINGELDENGMEIPEKPKTTVLATTIGLINVTENSSTSSTDTPKGFVSYSWGSSIYIVISKKKLFI